MKDAYEDEYGEEPGGGGVWDPDKAGPPVNADEPITDWRKWFEDLYKSKGFSGYSESNLAAMEADLTSKGWQLQKDSSGRIRGRVKTPTGEMVDLMGGPDNSSWAWVSRGVPGAGVWSLGGGGGGGGGGYTPPPRPSWYDDLIKQLITRSQQSLNINAATDPMIRSQVDPFVAQQTRSMRDYLGDIAERAGESANIQGERRVAMEKLGGTAGAYEAELIGRELGARRQEVAQALSSLTGIMTAEEERALRRELSQLDAELTRRGQDLSHDQFMADLGLRAEDRYNYWDWIRRGGRLG